MKSICDVIKETRQKKGITQKQMGEFLGIEQSGYAKMEMRGEYMPFRTLMKICEYLDYDIINLIIMYEPDRIKDDKEYNLMIGIILEKFEEISTLYGRIINNTTKMWESQRTIFLQEFFMRQSNSSHFTQNS